MVKKIIILVIELVYLNGLYPVLLKRVQATQDELDDKALRIIHSIAMEVLEKLKGVK